MPRKPSKPKSSKQDRVKQLVKEINRVMDGHGSILFADELPNPQLLRRPFGLPSLDIPIGGGVHASSITTISGPPGVGKSLLCWHIAAEVQRNYGEDACILYATNEGVLAKDLARLAGCAASASDEEIGQIKNIRNQQGLRPLGKEEIKQLKVRVGVLQQAVADSAEGLLEMILAATRSGLYQLIIIDSLTNLMPESVRDSDLGGGRVADKARIMTQFATKLTHTLLIPTPDGYCNETSIVGIKQVRANVSASAKYNPVIESVVAYALDHNRSLALELGKESVLGKGAGFHKEVHGKTIKWRVVKGKYGCHEGPSGSVDFYFDEGIDAISDIVFAGLSQGVIRQMGAWFSIVDAEENEVLRVQGKEALKRELATNPELALAVRETSIKTAQVVYRVT